MLTTTQILHTPLLASGKISILLVSPYRDDESCIRNILYNENWEIHRCTKVNEAIAHLDSSGTSIVICERDLSDGSWKDVLTRCQKLTHAPMLLVASRHADENLWGEVLNLGGYDVLMKPFDRSEVTHVVGMAWRHWLNPAILTQNPQLV